jgi:hypothetical protein
MPSNLQLDSLLADTSLTQQSPDSLMVDSSMLVQPIEVTIEPLPNFFFTTYNKYLLPIPKHEVSDAWIFGVILFVFLLLAIFNQLFGKELGILMVSPFKRKGLRKLVEDDSGAFRNALILISSVYIITMPIFIYQLASYWNFETLEINGFVLYLLLVLILLLLVLIKSFVVKFVGAVFQLKWFTGMNLYNMLAINAIFGFLLVPVSLGINLAGFNWVSFFIWLGIGLYIAFYALKSSLLLISAKGEYAVSKFHLFLYFCTLEILPLIILVKLILVTF